MLARALVCLKLAALATVTFLCVALGITVLSIRSDVRAVSQQANTALTQIVATTQTVGTEITTDADRLTTHADRLMIAAGATAREAHLASRYQRQFWEKQSPELARQASELLTKGSQVLESGNTVLLGLNETNTHVQQNLDTVTTAVVETTDEGRQVLEAVHAAASDPDVLATKKNIARTAAGVAQMSEDAAYKLHKYAHPEDAKGKEKVWKYSIGSLRLLVDVLRAIYFWP